MPNGSHCTGPSWGDVPSSGDIQELIDVSLFPLKKRIEELEKIVYELLEKEKDFRKLIYQLKKKRLKDMDNES